MLYTFHASLWLLYCFVNHSLLLTELPGERIRCYGDFVPLLIVLNTLIHGPTVDFSFLMPEKYKATNCLAACLSKVSKAKAARGRDRVEERCSMSQGERGWQRAMCWVKRCRESSENFTTLPSRPLKAKPHQSPTRAFWSQAFSTVPGNGALNL